MTQLLQATLRAANVGHYADGDEIERYLDEPHHRARIQLALKTLVEIMPPTNRKRGLELGAGSGKTALKIKALGYEVLAVDASSEALTRAVQNGLETLEFDASLNFPLSDGSFDFVFAGELIEHVFDTRHFLGECRRVLAPNGVLILTTPNMATLNDRVRFLWGYSPRQLDAFHEYLYLHIRPFTMRSLIFALNNCNFREIRIQSHLVEIGSNSLRIRSSCLGKLFPGLGKTLIATARK